MAARWWGQFFSYLYIGKIKNVLVINNWVDLEIIRYKYCPWVTFDQDCSN